MSRRRGHDNTGRSNGTADERKARKLNAPPRAEAWIWFTKQMLESPALRALSAPARKVIDRITLEHIYHGGGQNGLLAVTYNDFRLYGVRGSSILPAIEEAIALGFIERTDPGRNAWGEFKGSPALYRIAWLPNRDGAPAPNLWKRFRTAEEARHAAERAKDRVMQGRLEEAPRNAEQPDEDLRVAAE
jgi:hypothetical protein